MVQFVNYVDSSLSNIRQFLREGCALIFENMSCFFFKKTKKYMLFKMSMAEKNMIPLSLEYKDQALAVSFDDNC